MLSAEITLLTDNNWVMTFDSFILHSHEIRISEFVEIASFISIISKILFLHNF